MKDELDGKIMKEFVARRPKMYSYITDDDCVYSKAKGTEKCVVKREIKFEDCRNCLESKKTIVRSQQKFRGELHNVIHRKYQQDCS